MFRPAVAGEGPGNHDRYSRRNIAELAVLHALTEATAPIADAARVLNHIQHPQRPEDFETWNGALIDATNNHHKALFILVTYVGKKVRFARLLTKGNDVVLRLANPVASGSPMEWERSVAYSIGRDIAWAMQKLNTIEADS